MALGIKIAVIAAGGALGALARAGLSMWAGRWLGVDWPWGTVVVNVLGCGLMGAARAGVDAADWWTPELRSFVFAGFLGAFTTFSTFEADTVGLWGEGARLGAAMYMGASVVLGLLAFSAGWELVTRLNL